MSNYFIKFAAVFHTLLERIHNLPIADYRDFIALKSVLPNRQRHIY